jgi:integrase
MAKRRANGEGNIRKRKDGRWEGRYTAGRDPETGKVIYKNVLGKTQAEVKEKLKAAIKEAAGLDVTKSGQYTVGQWMDVWFENYAKIKVRPSSHQTYRGYIENHIKPNIGDIPLSKLTSLELQTFYKKLLAGGRVERKESKHQPKGLSPKTVRNIHQIISSALNLAKEQKLIATNPANACALPKLEHREMKTLPVEQLTSFLREAKESGVFELYYIELATGLRRGELLGLKWEDIDLEHGNLRVQRQLCRLNGEVVEAPLKTKNSYRNISLGQDAVEILTEQKRKLNGTSDYVFPSPSGGPISPDSVLHMLHRVLKRAGLQKVRFHDLRHTFATLALQNGVDIKTVSGMLGHYSAGFTLDTYAHVTTAAQREAAKTMANVLSAAAG